MRAAPQALRMYSYVRPLCVVKVKLTRYYSSEDQEAFNIFYTMRATYIQ